MRLTMPVAAPELWSPERPAASTRPAITLRDRGAVQQVAAAASACARCRSSAGTCYLNNRRVQLRGASIHEDMPGHGAALTGSDMDTIVAELKDLGANVTRSHYLMNDRLLEPLRPRGHPGLERGADLAARPRRATCSGGRPSAAARLVTVERTVKAGRSHPSVLTHSVANELSFTPGRQAAAPGSSSTARA